MKKSLRDRAKLSSTWTFTQIRAGKIIDKWQEKNIVTDEGLDHILDVAFSSGTQITAWYAALFNDDYTPVAGATYATPGYTETENYDEAVRQAWTEAGVSSQSITNSASKASFTMSTSETLYGAVLVGGGTAATTKGDTAGGGTLYNVVQFSTAKAVENDDIIKVVITLTSADDGA